VAEEQLCPQKHVLIRKKGLGLAAAPSSPALRVTEVHLGHESLCLASGEEGRLKEK
jgi:hypothetical protein